MIEVPGQYIFEATIAGIKDFINLRDLVSFKIIETAGTAPPSFIFEFYSTQDKIAAKLNEGAPIQVKLGESLDSFEAIDLFVSDFTYTGDGQRARYIVEGFAIETDYIVNPIKFISDKKSAMAVLKERASGFTVKSNIDTSTDSQNWVQPNIPNRMFFNSLLAHAYIPNSFLMSAVLADKSFVVKDAKKEAATKADKPDWILSSEAKGKNYIPYAGNFQINVNTGLVNNLAGYGRERIIYDIEKGSTSAINLLPKPVIALTRELARKSSIEKKFVGSGFQNENVHANYYRAHLNYVLNNIMMGAIKVSTSFDDRYRRVKPLDLVMFKVESKQNTNSSNDYTSGLYVVSGTTREIKESSFDISLTLARESFNQIKNT